MQPRQILAVGADARVLERLGETLRDRGYVLARARDAADCVRRFSDEGADLVLICLPLDAGGGRDLLRQLRDLDPRVQAVLTGSDVQVTGAADAVELEAVDYVADPLHNLSDLLAAVGVALGSRRGDAQLRYLKEREASSTSWNSIVQASPAMRPVVEMIRRVCDRTTRGAPPTILIRGETGTGKGLFAKCIHYNGARRNRAFVELNCAALPPTLVESELFGHERGAFTDARTSRAGLLETAHRGTLFLDEIASLGLDLQAKLLTAIEEKRIRRIGARQSALVDVQIIAASHMDLTHRVRNGAFREDLYHRLNVVGVTLPPLRDRGRDKITLANAFIAQTCREYGLPTRHLTPEAERHVEEYGWPGNVRELKNQIERIILLGVDEFIDRDHFEKPSVFPPAVRSTIPAGGNGAHDSGRFAIQVPDGGISLDEVERELIRRALDASSGNVSRAARFLRVSRQTFIYRMKKHGLQAVSSG